ncbi:MAG TPA: hypothetical protein VFF06_34500 [Polyangia bacterium]|nr:hypothetical protein [Polyangia bacterium]
MSARRHLRLIALALAAVACAPAIARAAEPFVEDRTLANGVRVVLAPLPSEPLELRAFGGGCAPCVEAEATDAALSRIRGLLAEPKPARAPVVVVVAGRFELEPVRAAIEAELGKLPQREPSKPRADVERYTRRPSDRARVTVALRAPAAAPLDAWATVLAERVLAARLERRRARAKTAVEWHAGALVVTVELDGAPRELLDEELQRLAREPASARELDAARESLPPPSRAARLLDLTLACGNPRLIRDAADDAKKVSPADVQRAAQRLADRAHRSTVETFVTASAALPGERGAPKVP